MPNTDECYLCLDKNLNGGAIYRYKKTCELHAVCINHLNYPDKAKFELVSK